MLTEKRQEEILRLLDEKGSITLKECKEHFQTSESTIRRDLTELHNSGKLIKVFGGAIAVETELSTKEEGMQQKAGQNQAEKKSIGKYAASLLEDNDFVFIDAGTTTKEMLSYIKADNVTFVTNAVSHARKLLEKGFRVILVGGTVKSVTEAVVGAEACEMLKKYNFTKGFFGTNGVSLNAGFTTPDVNEAAVKECAMVRCRRAYVLCDHEKFRKITPVTFGRLKDAVIITDRLYDNSFRKYAEIYETDR